MTFDEDDLDILVSLDGMRFEAASGYVIEYSARRTAVTKERPHGLSYALVFRSTNGAPYVRFDNAHAVDHRGGRYVQTSKAYDHWHRTSDDEGRLYEFTSPVNLLKDFRAEVKRVLDEKGIPHDL